MKNLIGLVSFSAFALLPGTPASAGSQEACDPRPQPGFERAAPCQQGTVEKAAVYVDDVLVDVIEYERVGELAIVGGDMLLKLAPDGNVYFSSKNHPGVSLRGAGRSATTFFWPNRQVPFRFNANLTTASRTAIQNAINHWQANSNVTFVTRTTETNFVEFFFQNDVCNSFVGRIGGMQRINIDPADCGFGGIVHEIGHALGLWHEQSRADRDSNVVVNWANIQTGEEHNFRTYVEQFQNGADYGAFDFGSIMLYSSNAFSSNGQPTLTRLNGTTWTAQRTAVSQGDKNAINCNMYPRALSVSMTCNGNFRNSLEVWCSATATGGGTPYTYTWTYSGTASYWGPAGNAAYARYNPPGCGANFSTSFNRFEVRVTDACGATVITAQSPLSCN